MSAPIRQERRMPEPKIKPCPFCGGRPLGPSKVGVGWVIVCVHPRCKASEVVARGLSRGAAALHWNTRKGERDA